MKMLALKYSHHHPAHSMILSTKDDAWKDYFSPQELHQINTLNPIELPSLPASLKEYFLSYQRKKTLDQLLEHRKRHDFNPRTQPDLYWAQKSIIHATDLFLYQQLPATYDTEKGQLNRKVVGTKVDLIIKQGNLEYGCMEAGCSDDPLNTKGVDEGRLKLPRTLKDILCRLTKEAPGKMNDIKVAGLVISGINITLYIEDCPAGSVTRLKSIGPYEFRGSVEKFAKKFIPLLALVVWQTKVIMKNMLQIINAGEEIIFPSIDGPEPPQIPPCMPSPKLGTKRKHNQVDYLNN
ncbi:hypothetical protein BDB00DRAFT_875156 [Zychaea mexicana]|uniref:uncharacterized protein n=1 Tax=Zychaea mexicana TaxID=64656 RepID=UPI0022FDE0F7|nr:uncharacterized protein BDB00DRAFT_875156 [Zychaea mexicana]KAI9490558.1 hypothetical protein BDB00DRAFT_875156 [Zychaea mexicana]